MGKSYLRVWADWHTSAFTMAEVLITLGIVGIIAAMTLPSVINNIRNKQLETQFKKAYSVISQALLLMKETEGIEITGDNYTSGHNFIPIFKKYFIRYNPCEDGSRCAVVQVRRNEYKTYNNLKTIYEGYMDDASAIFGADMDVYVNGFTSSSTYGFMIFIDINGVGKKPNRWGHDLFSFQVKNSVIVPVGLEGTAIENDSNLTPEKFCNINSTSNRNGFTCSARAISEKDYFKNLPK